MVDITSNILKDIFSKRLTKAKDGIAKSLRDKSFKAIEDYKNSFKFELPGTETSTTPETTKEGLIDVKRANRDKEASLRKTNKDKESTVRRAEAEKEQTKRRAEREKDIEKATAKSKKESLIQKVAEYITKDGARKKCSGGDSRRTENHDCDKVHSGMSHDEWEASKDTPKDEATGDKAAYKKFFDAKLKKYGVNSPAELEGDAKKKFYDEIDKEWEGDNEND